MNDQQTDDSLSRGGGGSLVDVKGILVGHAHDDQARTGCTVVLCGPDGATAAGDVRGAAPGTRETDLLQPGNLVERVHAILLTGGSVFGLAAAGGVVGFLEERGIGFDALVARVPIVPAAVIFDLGVGDPSIRPGAEMGYQACLNASDREAREGAVGAGSGATVGKIAGPGLASPAGIGTASARLVGGPTVAALAVVNAFGDIVDPISGEILAGARSPDGAGWIDTVRTLLGGKGEKPRFDKFPGTNTTLAVVATDALLSRAELIRVAAMAHDGMARTIRPVHTMFDGDTVFALSKGTLSGDVTTIGTLAAEVLARAITRSVQHGYVPA